MATLAEEIGQYDAEQRLRLREAAANPQTYDQEMRRIHEESRVTYLDILSRHNTRGNESERAAHT